MCNDPTCAPECCNVTLGEFRRLFKDLPDTTHIGVNLSDGVSRGVWLAYAAHWDDETGTQLSKESLEEAGTPDLPINSICLVWD